jgi:hypothetical protein
MASQQKAKDWFFYQEMAIMGVCQSLLFALFFTGCIGVLCIPINFIISTVYWLKSGQLLLPTVHELVVYFKDEAYWREITFQQSDWIGVIKLCHFIGELPALLALFAVVAWPAALIGERLGLAVEECKKNP